MRAIEFLKESEERVNKERLIPRPEKMIVVDDYTYNTYKILLKYAARDTYNDQCDMTNRGHWGFYSDQEFKEFKAFLDKENIDYKVLDHSNDGVEDFWDDPNNNTSPVPSSTFRDIFNIDKND